ncbi:hydrogenase expression/formation protein HypE [Sphaerimonospora sp. CA-214678]|uniref:hydrogenase expression/formation protein HypE n=1 Tax=Sphaerimonospora sp. CA-214678 TaxID=3240029 RepID=UPI003D91B4BB
MNPRRLDDPGRADSPLEDTALEDTGLEDVPRPDPVPGAVRAEAAVRETRELGRPDIAHGHLSGHSREEEVLERIERARKRRARIREDRITLAHGAGGKAARALIEAVFLEAFGNPLLEPLGDGAVAGPVAGGLAFTTDSFVVRPLFFPGGDIGDLAVNGTINDLAMCGATPRYLSAGFILEEGFPLADLRRVTASMAEAARVAGVWIVTGDTKVVENGKADGCYITTAGIGVIERPVRLSAATVVPGDAVIVSGPIGEHGMTIMLARGELDIEADLTSDTAPLHTLADRLLAACPGRVRCLRDATRGGVATVVNEIAAAAQVAIVLDERAVPVRPTARGACELLGIDPLYVACEGRMVAVVAGDHADAALDALRSHPLGAEAAVIGRAGDDPAGLVLMRTHSGGTRVVDLLVGDPLPRIC